MSSRFTIDRFGAQGDGIANTETGPVFVPFTLPGEVVTAAREKDRATLMAVLEPSPLRVEPACRHFGECGGCAVQHLEAGAYNDWKRDKVVEALKRERIEADVAATIPCPPASRRRVTLSARRTETGMQLGYNRAHSHTITDIEECPIAVPEIVAALGTLKALGGLICKTAKPFHLSVTQTASGLDIAATDSGELVGAARIMASDFVAREGLARLSVDGEIIVEPRKPAVFFGDVSVSPPPGGFLQAVAAAENAMVELVAGHLAKAKKIADLFAGSGAFALRLAKKAEVHAVEGDGAALAALDRGFRFGTGLKRVIAERRDLFRRPLTFKELNAFDGLVFDPPRAGAEDQSKQIARSDIPLVAAVSCNPATLARDLAILIGGGYRLKSVTPVDQFLWSPHVEAVALLEKPRKRR
ncbi:class I SAM-dependent RNA methyltransferase [Mesorhizobium sp. ZC-5]|uniref:class I SAM-dependent RNA methyltransferase n=1 Tax=Mesorhizobium sp. ZC-5 TaxID=2986066 RepID=UPI0021E91272|nr:class I SAM-dependent RNA methyltransferase [Mesorhizobium sp. ZC-5]MCV3243772.1 class I SAM-dependent RNA methyltransferase [Mesorhizobium sp. ZC-5]